MSAILLPALQRSFGLFALAFAAATMAFGTVMLTSPSNSEAAVSDISADGIIQPVTNCEFLPIDNPSRCTVYR